MSIFLWFYTTPNSVAAGRYTMNSASTQNFDKKWPLKKTLSCQRSAGPTCWTKPLSRRKTRLFDGSKIMIHSAASFIWLLAVCPLLCNDAQCSYSKAAFNAFRNRILALSVLLRSGLASFLLLLVTVAACGADKFRISTSSHYSTLYSMLFRKFIISSCLRNHFELDSILWKSQKNTHNS